MATIDWIDDGEELSPSVLNRALRAILTASGLNPDASFTGFTQNVSHAGYNIATYGAVSGASAAVTKAAILAAVTAAVAAGGGTVFFPKGDYDIGELTGGASAFSFTGAHDIRLVGDGARIICDTTDANTSTIFKFTDSYRIHVRGLILRDDGVANALANIGFGGAVFFRLISSQVSGFYRSFSFRDCACEGGIAFLTTSTTYTGGAGYAGSRLQGITVDNVVVSNSYYGINCQDDGDGLRARNFRCHNVKRAYFAYGVSDHDVDVTVSADDTTITTGTGCILIKRYYRDTRHVRVRVTVLGAYTCGTLVLLEHQPITGSGTSKITNVTIDFNVNTEDGVKTFTPLGFTSYLENGTQEVSTTSNQWDDIHICGALGAAGTTPSDPFSVSVTQTTLGHLSVDPSMFSETFFKRTFPGFYIIWEASEQVVTAGATVTVRTLPNLQSQYEITGILADTAGANSLRAVVTVTSVSTVIIENVTGTASDLTLSLSGNGVRFTNGGGTDKTVRWSIRRIT